MIQIARWKIFLIIAVCIYGFAYSSPNFVGGQTHQWMKESLPDWMPKKTVNLGLDLRGGAHLLYEVDLDAVFDDRADVFAEDFKKSLREKKIAKQSIGTIERGVRIVLDSADDAQEVKRMIRRTDPRLILSVDTLGTTITATMDDAYVKQVQDQTISQVIEVVRRRIDMMGTTEPVIQRQGHNRVVIQVPGADSKQLRDLVGQTAKLGFHLVGGEGKRKGSELSLSYADMPMRKINVKRLAIIKGDMLDDAQPTFNQNGQPVVSFRLNAVGARKFCAITRKNVGKPFAIVLDNKVISAPVINEAICGGQGQISGGFDVQEAAELSLLLRAGALPTDLKVVEERSVGPSLGADSVAAGKIASLIGLSLVLVFMFASYGLFGLMANVALVVNIALILAVLSSLQATLTLPGIAGIVLTVGMAVDANVLIFERIREEIAGGRSALSSIDAGYSRAMATIIDSNLTTLIAAMILFSFGTGPIKGFSVTLGVGILTSFFSAIFVTRLLVVLWIKKTNPKTVPI
ncbi:MAG: protein translocase subunit SecD [Alphaproteobacteria bacterium]|nr:MAG: protein translocase subunit SecD [Alphaproteobacteria bacterium]